jgi:hypothetical protein
MSGGVDSEPGPGAGVTAASARGGAASARSRGTLRAVALPTEHGGWGLTLEPALLGIIVAPSIAGACLAVGAVVAFLLRTPLKFVLVDAHRHRELARTHLARRVVLVESLVLLALVAVAVATADGPFWWPAAIAAPLVAVELWFDMRSRSRRLAPELAGACGIGAVAAMIALAGGESAALAAGLWLVLAARTVTAIPSVRAQVMALHGRVAAPAAGRVGDAAAAALAALAVVVDSQLLAGAVAVVAVVVLQHVSDHFPAPRAALLGVRQTALGFLVVVVTAIGILA